MFENGLECRLSIRLKARRTRNLSAEPAYLTRFGLMIVASSYREGGRGEKKSRGSELLGVCNFSEYISRLLQVELYGCWQGEPAITTYTTPAIGARGAATPL
jgi:hypothetical protein